MTSVAVIINCHSVTATCATSVPAGCSAILVSLLFTSFLPSPSFASFSLIFLVIHRLLYLYTTNFATNIKMPYISVLSKCCHQYKKKVHFLRKIENAAKLKNASIFKRPPISKCREWAVSFLLFPFSFLLSLCHCYACHYCICLTPTCRLQAEIRELKEQIQMYESASQFLPGAPNPLAPPHFDDSYMQLGIRTSSSPQTQSPASR